MHPKKKSLSLTRETVRQLAAPELAEAVGGIIVRTVRACPQTSPCHSLFDSCYNTDCCLEIP